MNKELKIRFDGLLLKKGRKEKELYNIKRAIVAIEEAVFLPNLKRKYEGKYFKFRNSYNQDTQWWKYSYCISVKGTISFICNTFEVTPMECQFKILHESSGEYLFQHKITKAEYNRALKSFLKSANKLTS